MVKKRRVHGLAHRVVAAEGKRDIGHAAAHLGAGQGALDFAHGAKEIDGVIVVLLDARGDGQDVRIDDNVLGRETRFRREQAVGPRADPHLGVAVRGLALFVEGHDDGCGAVAADEAGPAQKFGLAVFQRDGVDHALALKALQAGLEHAPF